jgi:hypothetical protein
MNKPLLRKRNFLLFAISLLFLTSAIVIYCIKSKFESKEKEGAENEEEGIPGVYLAMDLWSNMRTYPFKTMPAERFSEAYADEENGIERKLGWCQRSE